MISAAFLTLVASMVAALAFKRAAVVVFPVWLAALVPFSLFPVLHPAVVVFAVLAIAMLLSQWSEILKVVRVNRVASILIVAYVVFVVIASGLAVLYSRNGLALVVGPLLILFCTAVAASSGLCSPRTFCIGMVYLAVLESVFAILQAMTRSWLLYQEEFSMTLQEGYVWRSNGTFDHPLALGLFLVAALPMLSVVRNRLAVVTLAVLLFIGILLTGSRSAAVAGIVGGAVFLAWLAKSYVAKVVAGLIAAGGLALISLTPIGASTTARFMNDGGSAEARELASEQFVSLLQSRLWSGGGLGSSYRLAESFGLYSSFENAFYMLVVDIGLVGACCLYGLSLLSVIVGRRERQISLALSLFVVLTLTFSSIGATSASGILLGSLVGVALGVSANRSARLPSKVGGMSISVQSGRRRGLTEPEPPRDVF